MFSAFCFIPPHPLGSNQMWKPEKQVATCVKSLQAERLKKQSGGENREGTRQKIRRGCIA